jgi:hypothetical protein
MKIFNIVIAMAGLVSSMSVEDRVAHQMERMANLNAREAAFIASSSGKYENLVFIDS